MVRNLPFSVGSIKHLVDLYNEVFEIVDSCTFSAKAISPTMWQAFGLMHKAFKAGAELYLEGKSARWGFSNFYDLA